MENDIITKQMLISDIQSLNLPADVILAFHSSMKSLGRVENGPGTVIDAFIEALGPEATIMVPTFTYGEKHRNRPFDPEKSESVVGLITEVFRNRDDAIRSICPIHSVAAIGKYMPKN
ncbi:MAG: AAC(3) family N-acetyltransferase [bacterium]